MDTRITTQMVSSSTMDNIESAMARMERSSEELSTGKSIIEPSDDPYGASRTIALQSSLEGLSSYAANVSDATSWTETAESSMENIAEVAQRVHELVLQADNGTYGAVDREHIAGEIEQLTESVKQDANVQYAGQYVFSGTDTKTAPYEAGADDEYKGNTKEVERQIASGTTVSISSDLSSVLGSGQSAEDGGLLDTLRTIAEQLTSGSPEDLEKLRTTDLVQLESNIESLTTLQGANGALTDQLKMAGSRIEDLQLSTTQALTNTDGADFAKASIEYSSQKAAYEAALQVGSSILEMPTLVSFLS